jgi:hypothetical protein
MLQPTPPSGGLGLGFMGPAGGSYAGQPGSFMPGSTGQLLQQYSPSAAELHARAHAIAMTALQQLSPQLGSSLGPSSHMGPMLGSSVTAAAGRAAGGGGSGSYTASLGESRRSCSQICYSQFGVQQSVVLFLCLPACLW